MNLKQQNRENNKKYIAKVAFELFSKYGIENVSIPQVAKEAGAGTTSVYRYFENKFQLVMAATMVACTEVEKSLGKHIETKEYMEKTGIEQVRYILGGYIKMYDTNRNFLRFIYDFDNYLSLQDMEWEEYEGYIDEVQVLRPYFVAAVRKGINDGSIRKNINPELIYSTITDFVVGFCSRIAYFEVYRNKNTVQAHREQLMLALELPYTYLKNN